jgi:MFS family permease
VYYLPIWFQAINGDSAVDSGIHLLPMVMPIVAASVTTGQLVSRIGYYTPFMIFGVCLTAVGAGLLTTLEIDTSAAKWIGFQIVYGFGLGSCSQAPNMAAQTVLPREDVAIGASLMFFGQQLFGAVFNSVGQNVLDNQLANRLAGIPGISPRLIQNTGATELLNLIPAKYHAAALEAYNDSLRVCFQLGLIMACLSILGALGMEWRSVKKNLPPKNPDGERAADEGKGQGDLSEKKAPEAEAEAVAVAAADGEKDKDRDAAAAVLTVSTEATHTASQTEVALTSTLATVEKTQEKTEQKTEQKTGERTETEKAEAKEIAA